MKKLSTQMKRDVLIEVDERIAHFSLDPVELRRSCLYHAAFASLAIAKRGVRAILQAGGASWRFKARETDDGTGSTHFSYVFNLTEPSSAARMKSGGLPECHVWCAIPASGEIIDLTTGFLPELLAESLPNETWTEQLPPPYFWGPPEEFRDGWSYAANMEATLLAYRFLKKGHPDVFAEMQRRSIAPLQLPD